MTIFWIECGILKQFYLKKKKNVSEHHVHCTSDGRRGINQEGKKLLSFAVTPPEMLGNTNRQQNIRDQFVHMSRLY